jgi:hypothetical protein
MNGQPKKTIELYENEILNNKTIKLDAILATCVLSACSDCHRLDIGEYIHNEVIKLKLLRTTDGIPNIRLATAVNIELLSKKKIKFISFLFQDYGYVL